MAPGEIHGPDLAGVVADANEVGLDHVVIGGFAVIAHGYFRATKDSDLLVPDAAEADAAIRRFFEKIGATRFSGPGNQILPRSRNKNSPGMSAGSVPAA